MPGDKGEEPGWKKKFGVEKFDVIVGNPPYNKDGRLTGVIRKVCLVCVCVRVRYGLRNFLCPLPFAITYLPNSLLLHTVETSEKTSEIHKKMPKKFI